MKYLGPLILLLLIAVGIYAAVADCHNRMPGDLLGCLIQGE